MEHPLTHWQLLELTLFHMAPDSPLNVANAKQRLMVGHFQIYENTSENLYCFQLKHLQLFFNELHRRKKGRSSADLKVSHAQCVLCVKGKLHDAFWETYYNKGLNKHIYLNLNLLEPQYRYFQHTSNQCSGEAITK